MIERTVELLHRSLCQHFPGSGLSKVASEILDVTRLLEERACWIRPGLAMTLRGSVLLVVAAIVGALVWLTPMVVGLAGVQSQAEFMEAAESGLQLLLLLGAAIFFLVSLERRIVRQSVMKAVSELRSLVHVVDMHQLNKGPEHLRTAVADSLSAIPSAKVTELIRYLDYCSELLSMLSKMSAYYVQRVEDPVVVAAVQEVQVVTIGFSQKIWQKVAILDHMADSLEKKLYADRATS